MEHLPECRTITWASLIADAEADGEGVPASARRLATSDPESGIAKCATGCPHLERAIERGRELAERFGW